MATRRAHLLISGRVQGVAYRAHTQKEARERQLTGWVRNLSSSDVEAVFQGEEDRVEDIIVWCWKGPPAARVDSVRVTWQVLDDATGSFSDFCVKESLS